MGETRPEQQDWQIDTGEIIISIDFSKLGGFIPINERTTNVTGIPDPIPAGSVEQGNHTRRAALPEAQLALGGAAEVLQLPRRASSGKSSMSEAQPAGSTEGDHAGFSSMSGSKLERTVQELNRRRREASNRKSRGRPGDPSKAA